MKQIALTEKQKLDALAFKYYQGGKWEPKTGDYYTTSRADLQLYQIVEADDKVVKTRYCDPSYSDNISEWSYERFLLDFGVNRVWVPDWILEQSHLPKVESISAGEIEEAFDEWLHHQKRPPEISGFYFWKEAIKWYQSRQSYSPANQTP